METKRLLELAGLQLNEEYNDVDKLLVELKMAVNKIHGKYNSLKGKSNNTDAKIDDFLYGLPAQIDNLIKDK